MKKFFNKFISWVNCRREKRKSNYLLYKGNGINSVTVAGDFNDWSGTAKGALDLSIGKMLKNSEGFFQFSVDGIKEGKHEYKYIVDGHWEEGANRIIYIDATGAIFNPFGILAWAYWTALDRVDFGLTMPLNPKDLCPSLSGGLKVHSFILHGDMASGHLITDKMDPSGDYSIELDYFGDISSKAIQPFYLFENNFISKKPLGLMMGNYGNWDFRLFAPRAKSISLILYGDEHGKKQLSNLKMSRDDQGVWELSIKENDGIKSYRYRVLAGEKEKGQEEKGKLVSDPYAKANLYHNGPSLIIKEDFKWTDGNYKLPARGDLFICELSIRDYTSLETSGVRGNIRGKYKGLSTGTKKNRGLKHLRAMGYNAVELLPVFEFDDNPPGNYHWGYMSSFFFAPEASYATDPRGAQIREFKELVDQCHKNDLAVILDVVYNHVGEPNHPYQIDSRYYFRHDGYGAMTNYSGCGNDFASERPMARRMILDSIKYWIQEYHVDGFRFDLAELIDLETLAQIEEMVEKIKPGTILIAEPWSFRGSIKGTLNGSTWSSWNDDFRNTIKAFILHEADVNAVWNGITGSVKWWADRPYATVNYVESHDDYTLVDHLFRSGGNDARLLPPIIGRASRLCALMVSTSLGIPMFAQGMEYGRSKGGIRNSYDAGDSVNGIRWDLMDQRKEMVEYYRALIQLRMSPKACAMRDCGYGAPNRYYRIYCDSSWAIGYAIDPKKSAGGSSFLVFINGDTKNSVNFNFEISKGNYIKIGDGDMINISGLDKKTIGPGSVSLTVPPFNASLWMTKDE